MRSPASIQLLSLFSLAAATAVLPLACARAIDITGAAASASSSGSGGSGGSAPGPCTTAADCAELSDQCNAGACVNGTCVKAPANELGACNDERFCTSNDSCNNGVCQGTPTYCAPNDACHIATCDAAQDKCVQTPGNDGAQCDDMDACTLAGSCQGGTCLKGPPVDCSVLDDICGVGVCLPMTGCTKQPKNDGTPCNDGIYCTVSDQCQAGTCKGQPNTCAPPGDVCMVGMCNEAQKTCVAVPGPNGTPCNDKNACTSGEACSLGKCVGGVPANPGGACDDGNACTTVDTCNNNGVCVGSAPIGQCGPVDGCCPAGCTLANDSDCLPPCCGDKQNDFPPGSNCIQGAKWIAWEYTPTCSFNVTRIELHTDAGSVALLTDANGKPGVVLFQGALGPPDPQGWLGANVVPKIALTGGQKYWIAEAVGACSIATQGVMQTYYGSFNALNGPWDGPFMGHPWTSHVIGECSP